MRETMKYILLNICLIISSSSAMIPDKFPVTDRSKEIAKVTLARVESLNPRLLMIVRQSDSQNMPLNLREYHLQNPRSLLDRLKSMPAYCQLLHAASLQVRQKAKTTLSPEDCAMAPVDLQMFTRANKQWPFRSIQFELLSTLNEIDQIYIWAYGLITGWDKNHETAAKDLSPVKNDRDAFLRAIELCNKTIQEIDTL